MKEITKSGFQFTNPIIKTVLFKQNGEYNENKSEGLPVSYKVKVYEKEQSNAKVDVQIIIGADGDKTPFYINLTISSKFRWTDDVTDDKADSLLKQNAATMLISYARPIIAHLTADAGFRPFNLPFIDLSKDFTEE